MSEPISVITRMKVKSGKEDEFLTECNHFFKETRKESGCVLYDLYVNCKDGKFCIFHEAWKDQEAINKHINSSHFSDFMGKSSNFLDKIDNESETPFQVSIAKLFDPSNPPKSEKVIVATRMKSSNSAIEKTRDGTLNLVVTPSNKELGCTGYDLYQNNEEKSLFILYEQWKGFGAIQEHMKTEHFNNFMKSAPDLLIPLQAGKDDLFEIMICSPYTG